MIKSTLTMVTLAAIALATATACGNAGSNQAANQTDQTTQPSTIPQANQTTSDTAIPLTDQEFVTQAAQASLAEVQLANLAQQRASSDEVKEYARKMVQDHTKANNELKQLAAQKQLTVPTTLDAKHQAAKAQLSGLSGEPFDNTYMSLMQQDHANVVALFQQQSNQGQDADLKNWAAKMVPTLQAHGEMAQKTDAETK